MSKVSIILNNRSRQVRRCYCKNVRNRKGEGIHAGVGVGVREGFKKKKKRKEFSLTRGWGHHKLDDSPSTEGKWRPPEAAESERGPW